MLYSLAAAAVFALAPATLSAQPLYVPGGGGGSFGPGNYGTLTPAYVAPTTGSPTTPPPGMSVLPLGGVLTYGQNSFGPTGGIIAPTGRANPSNSALYRGPNSGYFDSQFTAPRTYQSPADLMHSPRQSTRAPFQYLPGPARP
jgi:hypothetical protein